MLEAWNKIDLLAGNERESRLAEAARRADVVPVSALTGEGMDVLRQCMADKLKRGAQLHAVRLSAGDGGKIAWLHARGDVIAQQTEGSEVHLQVRLSSEDWARFQSL